MREIFARYAAGESCQRIAAALNERGSAGPRGGTWSVSAIYGSPAKGLGILGNELYVGRYVWNRSRWVKDPDTKKWQRLARPRGEWTVLDRPELRIVDEGAWKAVRVRMKPPATAGGGKGRGRMPTTLFGGLLRCGRCGGSVVAVNAYRYGCAAAKDRGKSVCIGIGARKRDVDSVLLSHLRDEILAPATITRIEREAIRFSA